MFENSSFCLDMGLELTVIIHFMYIVLKLFSNLEIIVLAPNSNLKCEMFEMRMLEIQNLQTSTSGVAFWQLDSLVPTYGAFGMPKLHKWLHHQPTLKGLINGMKLISPH